MLQEFSNFLKSEAAEKLVESDPIRWQFTNINSDIHHQKQLEPMHCLIGDLNRIQVIV